MSPLNKFSFLLTEVRKKEEKLTSEKNAVIWMNTNKYLIIIHNELSMNREPENDIFDKFLFSFHNLLSVNDNPAV